MDGMKRMIHLYAPLPESTYSHETSEMLEAKRIMCLDKYNTAKQSQVIVFDSEQVKVFWGLICSGKFLESVDYRLPFPDVWLQFSGNVVLDDTGTELMPDLGNVALLLTQQDTGANRVLAVHEENDDVDIIWNSSDPSNMVSFNSYFGDGFPEIAEQYRALAIACIAYINCENVYLHREATPERVNAKRERKGKSRLEPYYVCRIRGVQYDSAGNPTGEGAKHGIRYDVRGHFRRMTNGRTTWVRPHQRGLTNDLYVPKTYVVDKRNTDD